MPSATKRSFIPAAETPHNFCEEPHVQSMRHHTSRYVASRIPSASVLFDTDIEENSQERNPPCTRKPNLANHRHSIINKHP